jgi:hypothetical protein
MIKTIGRLFFALTAISASAFAGEATTLKVTVQNPELVKKAIVLMDDSNRPFDTGPMIQAGKVFVGEEIQNLSRKGGSVCLLIAERKIDLAKGTQLSLKITKNYPETFSASAENVAGLKGFGFYCIDNGQATNNTPLSYSLAHVLQGIFAVELK